MSRSIWVFIEDSGLALQMRQQEEPPSHPPMAARNGAWVKHHPGPVKEMHEATALKIEARRLGWIVKLFSCLSPIGREWALKRLNEAYGKASV